MNSGKNWGLVVMITLIGVFGNLLFGEWGSSNLGQDSVLVNKMVLCLHDKQVPCRWVGNYGNELGSPIFSYVAPLPYYVGSFGYLLIQRFSLIVKLMYLLPLLAVQLWLLKMVWNEKQSLFWVTIVGVGLWLSYWVLVFILRLDLGSIWAIGSLAALVASFNMLYGRTIVKSGLWLTWFTTIFILSRRESVYIFAVVFAVSILGVWLRKKFRVMGLVIASGILALGMSAFYVLPMIVEADYARLNTENRHMSVSNAFPANGLNQVERVSILAGDAGIFGFDQSTNWFRFGVEVADHSIIRVAVPYFPNWQVKANGEEIIDYHENNSFGFITLILGTGRYIIEGRLTDTPVREISNMVSLVSLIIFCLLLFSEMGGFRRGFQYYMRALHSS